MSQGVDPYSAGVQRAEDVAACASELGDEARDLAEEEQLAYALYRRLHTRRVRLHGIHRRNRALACDMRDQFSRKRFTERSIREQLELAEAK